MSLLYYVDYMGFRTAATLGWDNLPWSVENVDPDFLWNRIAGAPKVMAVLPLKILTQVIAVAMLAGVIV